MRKLLPFLILILIALSISCKKPEAFIYKDLRNFRVNTLGMNKSRVSMDLVFVNPNKYGINLKTVNGDIYIDSNYAGQFLLDTSMYIPKNAEFTLPASVDVEMKIIFKNAVNVLIGNEVLVGAKGTTRVGKGGVYVTIPFQYEGKQKLNLF